MLSRYVVSQVKHNSYFLVGLALGLWLSLVLVPLEEEPVSCRLEGLEGEASSVETARDEYEPQREERPLGPAGQAGRAVQRPRYYSTELGMRAALLAGVLSSEEMLETRATALNKTAAGLLPALRFFITASSLQVKPGRANVVGFTDTREMLKPFHALKYLADNYLEEYNFFFLVSDMSYVNARRLNELVSKLSVSQDVYMGAVAEDDTHYCTLEGGILLSNSVLRALHGELDWCVRNSYSAHHHENIGRCVLHAAHLSCASHLQGEEYLSARVPAGAGGPGALPLASALATAVTVAPLPEPRHFHELHAYVSRVRLQRGAAAATARRAEAAASARRHPRGFRNASWPAALRADAGLAPPPPPTRFDHPRWTRFNGTHAFLPDDLRAVGPLTGANARAVQMIVDESLAWARVHWGVDEARLLEGAWCWEPPYALRYRLLVRLGGAGAGASGVRQLEAVRPLGAARLAPARYVTETGRVTLVVGVPPTTAHRAHALAFLRRYESACLERDANTALLLVLVGAGGAGGAEGAEGATALREAARAMTERHRGARVELLESGEGPPSDAVSEPEWQLWAGSRALQAAAPHLSRDTLMLLLPADAEFSEDFLNRVRMNTIAGEQWYLPSGFHRYAHYSHPHFVDPDGARPQLGTGHFPRAPGAPSALAVYRGDYVAAAEAWSAGGGVPGAPPAAVLAAAPLRCLRAPEPALLLPAPPPPCPTAAAHNASATLAAAVLACLQRERDAGFSRLNLGARHTLAKLLLHEQALLA